MKKMLAIISLTVLILSLFTSVYAENNERVIRTYKVFSTSLDKLLLDTRHVYIKVGHETDGFYLPDFGAVFTGNISITAGASLPKVVEQWSQWFQHEDGKIIINTKNNKMDEECEEEARKQAEKEKKYKQADIERLEKMQNSIDAFKLEVMELILDFGPVIQGTKNGDKLAIVFHVADEEYFKSYNSNTLQVQVNLSSLENLAGGSIKDKSVQKLFDWNI